jgi:hypothetical protein
MLLFMSNYLGTEIGLEEIEVALLETGYGHQVFEELDTPVARVILGLVLDMIAPLTVPRTHANVLGNYVDGIGDAEGSRQRWKKAVDEVPRVGIQCFEPTHSSFSGGLIYG